MIKHWRLKKTREAEEYLVLHKDSLQISSINKNNISIDRAIAEQKLFRQTKTYRFSEMESIIFDEDNFRILLKHLPDENYKKEGTVEIEVEEGEYHDLKKHFLKVFKKACLKDLSFFEREKLCILSVLSTGVIGFVLFSTVGLSLYLTGFVIALGIIEICVLKTFFKPPQNAKILKLN